MSHIASTAKSAVASPLQSGTRPFKYQSEPPEPPEPNQEASGRRDAYAGVFSGKTPD
ncbi:MAG: hypothetical protein ACI8UD_000553 [Planctomycetota bacterium]|jgi:hypothetical protein